MSCDLTSPSKQKRKVYNRILENHYLCQHTYIWTTTAAQQTFLPAKNLRDDFDLSHCDRSSGPCVKQPGETWQFGDLSDLSQSDHCGLKVESLLKPIIIWFQPSNDFGRMESRNWSTTKYSHRVILATELPNSISTSEPSAGGMIREPPRSMRKFQMFRSLVNSCSFNGGCHGKVVSHSNPMSQNSGTLVKTKQADKWMVIRIPPNISKYGIGNSRFWSIPTSNISLGTCWETASEKLLQRDRRSSGGWPSMDSCRTVGVQLVHSQVIWFKDIQNAGRPHFPHPSLPM